MPSIFIFLIVLIVYPPSRNYLFPPVPQSMVDSRTGAIKKPKAGLLGSKDTLTGAQERHKGEAAEQEAHNFITGLGAIAFSSATGEQSADIQPGEDGDGGSAATSEAVPNPAAFAMSTADASQAHGSKRHLRKHDKTKQPMETMMWTKVRPVMHGLSEVTDTWERVGNCLNPVPPFHANRPRMRIASLLVPAVAMSLMLTPAMFTRGTYALVGFIFFSDPLQKRGIALLNQYYPQWPELLELRRTIFKVSP